jgi:signal-transduction protein with cAMP-binding, CBS, and nucleotidyltransferase domain
MNILLSAKGSDITTWRAVQDFASLYRQAVLDRASFTTTGNPETVFSNACDALETVITTHKKTLRELEDLTKAVSVATSSMNLEELTVAFYQELYSYFELFRSPPAFYQLSMSFLRQVSATIVTLTAEQFGTLSRNLPKMALFAVGAAGRGEYSPFAPLQILIVHEKAASSQLQSIDLFCTTLHNGFTTAGLSVDPEITPRNAIWRGTPDDWQQRSTEGLQPRSGEKLKNLCRLVDLYPLCSGMEHTGDLKKINSAALSGNRAALSTLTGRMASLSNGLGMMGRLKVERSGDARGLFNLREYGVEPLSTALSVLALIKESHTTSNCERIHELLRRRELDVELSERMLATWYFLHDLLLYQEQGRNILVPSDRHSFLDPDKLTAEQRQSLKNALESVTFIQRHVEIFSGRGE